MFLIQSEKSAEFTQPCSRLSAAFTLVEVLVAMMLSVLALTAFYASSGQAVRIVKSGKETALASQLLQERIEALRSAPLWSSVTTPSGLSTIMTNATSSATNFPGATEAVTIASYPAGGTAIFVARGPTGAIFSSGSSLSAQKCVKATIEVSWVGVGNKARRRQIATLITKGGL